MVQPEWESLPRADLHTQALWERMGAAPMSRTESVACETPSLRACWRCGLVASGTCDRA